MRKKEIKRGEIYYADLNPVIGSEQGGVRPVLILQNDTGNRFSPTVIVAAITGRQKKEMPTHVTVTIPELPQDSIVLLEQIRTIDKQRISDYVGKISKTQMRAPAARLSIGRIEKPFVWIRFPEHQWSWRGRFFGRPYGIRCLR